jgi:FkbM family methyltransferase
MKLRSTLARYADALVRPAGFRVIFSGFYGATQDDALRGIAKRFADVNTIIDIGASDGRWSQELMRHLPTQRYLLIEAQDIHAPQLDRFVARRPNAQYVLAAAGDHIGHVYFDSTNAFAGQASSTERPGDCAVPVTTVDEEVRARDLPGPYLLKFDTHGFELPILAGAADTLNHTAAILMECYNFRLAPDALLFHEMCGHLAKNGFRVIDLFDPMHRPFDSAFWQCDIVFARDDSHEFQYNGFR